MNITNALCKDQAEEIEDYTIAKNILRMPDYIDSHLKDQKQHLRITTPLRNTFPFITKSDNDRFNFSSIVM